MTRQFLSKSISLCSLSIAITCITSLTSVGAAQAISEGVYWGGGSRYIQIAKRVYNGQNSDDVRVCYQGFSSNGSTIASLKLKIPRYQTGIDYEVYTFESTTKEFRGLAIQQLAARRDKIVFGNLVGRMVSKGIDYQLDSNFPSARSPELQACLNSQKPYFKRILPSRSR